MKKFFILIFVLINPHSLFAETKQLNIVDGGNKVGYPPYYYYKDKTDTYPQGILPDIITEAAKEIDVRINWKSLPWNRALKYMENGKVDAMLPLIKTLEREEFMFFPETEISYEKNSFFVHPHSSIKYSGNIQELNSYKIGIIDKYSYGKKFDLAQNSGLLKLEIAFNENQLIRMFLKNRFEIGIGNQEVISWSLKKMNYLDKVKFISPTVSIDPLFIAFSKKSKGMDTLTIKFSQALRKIKEKGILKTIHRKHGVNIDY